jgi:hypothetical protein
MINFCSLFAHINKPVMENNLVFYVSAKSPTATYR